MHSSLAAELNSHGDSTPFRVPCSLSTVISFHTVVPCSLSTVISFHTVTQDKLWQLRVDDFVGHIRWLHSDVFELTLMGRNEPRPDKVYYVVNTERGDWSYAELLTVLINTKWGFGGHVHKQGSRTPMHRMRIDENLVSTKRTRGELGSLKEKINASSASFAVKEMRIWLLNGPDKMVVKYGVDACQVRFCYNSSSLQPARHYQGIPEITAVLEFENSVCSRVWCWVNYGEESEGFKEWTNIPSLIALRGILEDTNWCDYQILDALVPVTME